MFRCGICNVVSRDLIQHDKHLQGKRHKRNFNLAASGDTGKPSTAAESEPQGKRQKQNAKDLASVEAALYKIAAEAAAETEAVLERMLTGEVEEPSTACSVPDGTEELPSDKLLAVETYLEGIGGADKITRVGSKFGLRKAQLMKHFHVFWPEGANEHFVSLSPLPARQISNLEQHDSSMDGEPLLQSELVAALREMRRIEAQAISSGLRECIDVHRVSVDS
mmetsp:Transcript_11406/g.20173  ORF Transcript_11406/g.20173 Transcript_11406/m.20173 type:complete len:222 (-) Transcript_11406:91-756(-)